jgi:hypothetical protein
MDANTYQELRAAMDAESISYGELAEIESAFSEIPDQQLRDRRENATADDMLDEIAAHFGFLPTCHPECGPITSRSMFYHAHDNPQDGRCWHENADGLDVERGTPCFVCGAPIINGSGHDDGCMVLSMHPVNDPGSVVWHGGIGHKLLSTDGPGVECYRCGMVAEGSAWQELIPDCAGPTGGGDHHWMGHTHSRNECAYGDASTTTEGFRADRVYASCRRAVENDGAPS